MKEQAYKKIEAILRKKEIEFDNDIRTVDMLTLGKMLNTLNGEVSSKDWQTIKEQYSILRG